jgi:catechol 2,3-dioxygenase-like lactoylglutathione lyase family enzyme
MPAPLIEHIGILVPNLEQAIERWSAVTGYTFSPIARYRTDHWSDSSNPTPHHHDARISFSKEGPPQIELMEVTGSGAHGASQLGFHHLAIRGLAAEAKLAELGDLGIRSDGRSIDADGRLLLFFTQKHDLDGIRIEYIAPIPGPLVADDGSPLWRDPESGRASLWGPPDRQPMPAVSDKKTGV